MKAPILIAAALTLSACSGDSDDNRIIDSINATNKWLSVEIYSPGYQNFADQTASLSSSISSYCDDASTNPLTTPQNEWKSASLNWQIISHLVFAPLTPELQQRVQFFPDENGLVSQQIEALLAASDPVNEQSISSSTAPLQGLPALEYLLFGDNAASQFITSSRRCEASKAISAHLASRSVALNADWLLEVDSFVAAGQPSLGKTTVAVESAISNIRDNELGNPLGLRGQGAASPDLVETPWAKISFATLDGALTSIEDIMVGDGNQAGLAHLLSQYQNAEYSDQLLALITNVKATLNDESDSLFNAVSDSQAATRLTALFDGDFSELRNQMQTLGQRMGIDDGFNADDGD